MSSNLRVLNASAGSGKTTRIVNEYLYLILQNENPFAFKEILAITFTNKAAQEMKQRVIEELQNIKNGNFEHIEYLLEVQKRIKIETKEYQKRANSCLFNILHNYSDFAISTIDAFVLKLLKTFSKDLNLPTGFEVNMDTTLAIEQSVNLMIEESTSKKELLSFIIDFTLQRISEEKSWNIEYTLYNFCKIILEPENANHLKSLAKHSLNDFKILRNRVQENIKKYEETFQKIGKQAFELIAKYNLDIGAFPGGKSGGIGSYFNKVSKGDYSPPGVKALSFYEKDYASKVSIEEKQAIDLIKEDLRAYLRNVEYLIEEQGKMYLVNKLILRSLYPMGLLKEVSGILEQSKNEENYILISDFNKIVTEAIKEEPAPFINHRIGERYKHIFIDEFQDTSILQWQNLFPLVENSLGGGNEVLIVGDVKQSIYRWRGGEAEQLAKFPEPIKAAEKEHLRFASLKNFIAEPEPLITNYRSEAKIIEFNNSLFSNVSEKIPEAQKEFFKGFRQDSPKKETKGMVQISIFKKDELLKTNQLEEVLRLVKSKKEKNIPLNNIAILCRKNDEVSEVAGYLAQNSIPVISAEGLLVKNSPKVCLVATCIIYLESTTTNKELNARLNIWLLKNNINANVNLNNQDGNLLFDAFPELKRFNLLESTIAEKAEKLCSFFGFLEEENGFIASFLEALYNAEVNSRNKHYDFKNWWEENNGKIAIESPENLDAVQVMSIHKSKGLQFETVILPFVWYGSIIRDYAEWVEVSNYKESFSHFYLPLSEAGSEALNLKTAYETEKTKTEIDAYNLLYVACTRAKRNLYLLSRDKKGIIETTISETVESFGNLKEIGEGKWKYGEESYKELLNSKETKNRDFKNFFTDWKSRIKVASKREPFKSSAMEKGLKIHEIFEKIKSIDSLKSTWFQKLEVNTKTKIENIVTNDKLKECFEAKNQFNEAEILLNDGTKYRPDKVSVSKNKTCLIDFKTGEQSKKHVSQIEAYKVVLKEMGYENIEAFLAYVDLGEIIKVD